MDKMGDLDYTHPYIVVCNTYGIAVCASRTAFFAEASY